MAFIGTIWTGFDSPTSSGPMTALPPSVCSSLEAMLAECRAGMIRMLAGPVRRQNG